MSRLIFTTYICGVRKTPFLFLIVGAMCTESPTPSLALFPSGASLTEPRGSQHEAFAVSRSCLFYRGEYYNHFDVWETLLSGFGPAHGFVDFLDIVREGVKIDHFFKSL